MKGEFQKSMEEVTLELETVTPLFIAGADQRTIGNEGLRAPTLRGLLRWWFRAIMGGIVSVSELKKLESKIFGSTDKKSSVAILSTTEGQPSEIDIPSNLRYLWFSIYMQRRKNQRLQCYPPKTRFEVRVILHDENSLKIVLGCLWALIYLGGIGARMRRGAGSLKVNNTTGETLYQFVFKGNTINDARRFIEENLTKIFENFKECTGERYSPQMGPGFAVLSHAKMYLINQSFNKWEDGIEKVSNAYRSYRVNRSRDVTKRFIWGLPILSQQNLRRYENLLKRIFSKSFNKEDVDKEIKKLRKLDEKELLKEIEISKDRAKRMFLKLLLLGKLRQASPLFIGVMDLNGTYAVRLVKFYTSIRPNFQSKLKFLEWGLNGLDNKIGRELGEVEIKIPEVK